MIAMRYLDIAIIEMKIMLRFGKRVDKIGMFYMF